MKDANYKHVNHKELMNCRTLLVISISAKTKSEGESNLAISAKSKSEGESNLAISAKSKSEGESDVSMMDTSKSEEESEVAISAKSNNHSIRTKKYLFVDI
jgi:hypothetical protein